MEWYLVIIIAVFTFLCGLRIGKIIPNGRAISWEKLNDGNLYRALSENLYCDYVLVEDYLWHVKPFLVFIPRDVCLLKNHDLFEIKNGSLCKDKEQGSVNS